MIIFDISSIIEEFNINDVFMMQTGHCPFVLHSNTLANIIYNWIVTRKQIQSKL